MATYVLPDLPYDYAELEPYISAKTMQAHHDRHHAAYVVGANEALESLAEARDAQDEAKIRKFTDDLAFNLAGHVNHSVFWENLSPNGGGEPTGELLQAIACDFGSFEGFKLQFSALANSIQGSGWTMLAYDHAFGGLRAFALHDHQVGMSPAAMPLLMLDMWEHAFYLDYQNVKADYVAAFWEVVNWDNVAARYQAVEGTVAQ